MKLINDYINEALIKRGSKIDGLVSTYREGDDIDSILKEFDKKYYILLYLKKNEIALSSIVFYPSKIEDWSAFNKYDGHNRYENMIKYIIACNIDKGPEYIADALNESTITYNNWVVDKDEKVKDLIQLKCKSSKDLSSIYFLHIWKN